MTGKPAAFRPASLDAVNFLVADVAGALGPFLNVYLVTQQHWSQAGVGWVTSSAGLFGIALQTPIGAAIDGTRAKRGVLILALAAISLGAVGIWLWPHFGPVLVANCLMAVAGDVTGPAVAAITLGLVSHRLLARRMGRNSAWDHAGNVAIAVVGGAVGWKFGQAAVFLLAPLFALAATGAVLTIPAQAIDQVRARGGKRDDGQVSVWQVLLKHRALRIYAGAALLFHFANAPLLPLVGQKLALANPAYATASMSACIVAAQAIMLPIAIFVGRSADRIGRKPILLAGFAILPIRAALYTLSDDSAWLIAVQLLDGVGAGVYGALTPLVLADVMRGTGHYNLAQGAVATLQGIGAALSGLAVGLVVDRFGYAPAFLGAAVVASGAFALLCLAMPETAPGADEDE